MNPSPAAIPKAVWIAAAAFASVIVILLAAVLYKLNRPSAPAPTASAALAATAPVAGSMPAASTARAATASAAPMRRSEPRRTERRRIDTRRSSEHTAATAPNTPPAVQPAPPPCRDCGTVVGVAPERVEGQANGAGAVLGGVLGGILGHQVGGGNGQTAATVLGAIGGGLAGNEVQKRVNAHTVYRVEIRMEDGSTRHLTLADAPPVGTHVRVGADGSVQPAP